MNAISFISGIAFIVSCILKVVSVPFVLIYHFMRGLVRCIKYIKTSIKKFKIQLKQDRKNKEKNQEEKHGGKAGCLKKIIRKVARTCPFRGKIYAFFAKVYEIIYRVARRSWEILYRGIHWLGGLLYRGIHWLGGLLYRGSHYAYWMLHRIWRYFYWKYYYTSRKLYQEIIKNAWCDVFFVYLRKYLKAIPVNFSGYNIVSTKKYAKNNKKVFLEIIEPSQLREVCIPEVFEHSVERVEKYSSPDIYLALVPNVSVVGGSNVIITEKYLLNDAVAEDREKRIDIRYASINTVLNRTALVEDAVECINIEKAINLIGAASFNYYHLVVEILSRLAFVDRNKEYADYPILVDEVVLRIPQFNAALTCVNKLNHEVISVKKAQQYNIKYAVLPSSNVWMPTNVYNRNTIRTEDFLISNTVLNNIRSSVKLYIEKKPFRKIFISRKNTQAVRLKNEEVIREIFRNNGFEIIYTEELSFQEQIDCFGQASCVVAASGAALTNIIFCQPGTVIGCIIPEEHRFYMYSTIAHLLGLVPFFLDGKIIEKTPYAAADTFVLDEDYANRYIMELKNRMKE